MPAQPAFFTPTRTPATGPSASSMISRTPSAAASVRDMILSAMKASYRYLTIYTAWRRQLPPVERDLGFLAHARRVPGRVEHHVDGNVLDALDTARGVFYPARHFAGHRTPRRGQRHVDGEVAVVIEVDLVDEAQLVDIDRYFRVVDGFQRPDEVAGDPFHFRPGKIRRHSGG